MSHSGKVRVLEDDDSAFARKVLRESLSTHPDIEVVATARDGLEALEKIGELKPDVVTLDLVMPNLDGLGVLHALPPTGGPRVVIVSISDSDSALGVEALQAGAVELVHKPTALATDRLYELSGELIQKVLTAGGAVQRNMGAPPRSITPLPGPLRALAAIKLVVVGTSTGGPQALTRLLTALPADLPCAVAVALHIPAGYTEALARPLNEQAAVTEFAAWEGALLAPGSVTIARGGSHLRVRAAKARGPAATGGVLTGMGDDGVRGSRAIRDAGGRILTEAASSCVVYGLPRAVTEAQLSMGAFPIDEMASAIVARLG